MPPAAGAWPILAQVEGLTDRTGVILVTEGAAVRRLSPRSDAVAPPVGFDLEASLRARAPLPARTTSELIMRAVKLKHDGEPGDLQGIHVTGHAAGLPRRQRPRAAHAHALFDLGLVELAQLELEVGRQDVEVDVDGLVLVGEAGADAHPVRGAVLPFDGTQHLEHAPLVANAIACGRETHDVHSWLR